MTIINPDHYLETADGRVVTLERNRMAWQKCFQDLSVALAQAKSETVLYVLIGAQGAGKSTWARNQKEKQSDIIIFDAILVQRSERAPILKAADKAGINAVAVWFQTTLEQCITRNSSRPADQVANEGGLRNVFSALEPPSLDEGFTSVLLVPPNNSFKPTPLRGAA